MKMKKSGTNEIRIGSIGTYIIDLAQIENETKSD